MITKCPVVDGQFRRWGEHSKVAAPPVVFSATMAVLAAVVTTRTGTRMRTNLMLYLVTTTMKRQRRAPCWMPTLPPLPTLNAWIPKAMRTEDGSYTYVVETRVHRIRFGTERQLRSHQRTLADVVVMEHGVSRRRGTGGYGWRHSYLSCTSCADGGGGWRAADGLHVELLASTCSSW